MLRCQSKLLISINVPSHWLWKYWNHEISIIWSIGIFIREIYGTVRSVSCMVLPPPPLSSHSQWCLCPQCLALRTTYTLCQLTGAEGLCWLSSLQGRELLHLLYLAFLLIRIGLRPHTSGCPVLIGCTAFAPFLSIPSPGCLDLW